MALNVAEFVLNDIYDLYEAALGASAAWWVGHLTPVSYTHLTLPT